MGLIPKIALTPVKWASKKIVHTTLLRFPGGDSHSPVACTYCPEMCRFSCPTAVASGNDAVTPSAKNSLLYKESRWPGVATGGGELWPIYDCTGCGRCTEYCVYGVPVAEQLFEARSTFQWERSRAVLAEIRGPQDRWGDLAEELGDRGLGLRRLELALGLIEEPRALAWALRAREKGWISGSPAGDVHVGLSWEKELREGPSAAVVGRLRGRRWLVHESSALNRLLSRSDDVQAWITRARAAGIDLVRAFHQGRDCIDCGGEGAYVRLFPEQADRMALDIWERDRERAGSRVDGVLCFSKRCAEHFRGVLAKQGVQVESVVG